MHRPSKNYIIPRPTIEKSRRFRKNGPGEGNKTGIPEKNRQNPMPDYTPFRVPQINNQKQNQEGQWY